jgi:aminoacyl tRNA synthase complex-interacting multifunctional protein 1
MLSISVSPTDQALALILDSFKDLTIARDLSSSPIVSHMTLSNSETVSGSNTIISYLASLIPKFRDIAYTELEKAEVEQWLTLSNRENISEDTLDRLNEILKFRTTILGEKWSIADVAVYVRVKEAVRGWSDEQRTGEKGRRYVVRWLDFVQNCEELGLAISDHEKVPVDVAKVLFHPKPEEAPKKEKKPAAVTEESGVQGEKKVKAVAEKANAAVKSTKDTMTVAAASAAGGKQGQKSEKKQKQKREPPPPKEGKNSHSFSLFVFLNLGFFLIKITHVNSRACHLTFAHRLSRWSHSPLPPTP